MKTDTLTDIKVLYEAYMSTKTTRKDTEYVLAKPERDAPKKEAENGGTKHR